MRPEVVQSDLRIVFMGTPDFAVPSLKALVTEGYRPQLVVTVPDKPQGRGLESQPSAVKEAAERHGIRIAQPEDLRDPEFISQIAAIDPEIIVVVAFRILPPEVFSLASEAAFNLHASLLPRYRGAAPINRAIMAGEIETGVTTFLLRPEVDTGDVILVRRVSIGPDETAGELHDRLADLGANLVVETVRHLEAGTADIRKQDDSRATRAPKIFKEDARIPWTKTSADVHNHIRGLSPYPAAWTKHDDTTLRLFVSRTDRGMGEPGEVLEASGDLLKIACEEGAIRVLEVQREGRQRMSAGEFLNGYDIRVGDRLT